MSACRLWAHDINLHAEARSVSRARDFIRAQLAAHDLPLLVDDVVLVVSELATNAVQHAQTPFRVALHAFEWTVLLEVQDGAAAGPRPTDAPVLDTSGRGMTIVDLLSRDWGVDLRINGGKTVWAEFER